ncbi:MAG: Ig-like domain-containing protein, partial [Candidatus Pacearchaeota archaeon]|nr:Ig-like domain-containing protein [Candidatus Pacearchaeota archaeon]
MKKYALTLSVIILTALAAVLLTKVVIAAITSITLVSPSDNSWTDDNTPSFTFKAISNSSPTFSCYLTIDGSNVASNGSVSNNTNTILTSSDILSDGSHKWNITCDDGVGTMTSTTRTINVDTQDPQVTLISPTDGSSLSSTKVNFKFKVTDNLD